MNKITRKKYLSTPIKAINYLFKSKRYSQVVYMAFITCDNKLRRTFKR